MKFDLISLNLFISVCEEGTIAKAAEREFIAASAISKRISDLENLFNTQLLIREKKGVRPTTEGRLILKYAHEINTLLRHMQKEIDQVTQNPNGQINIAANISSISEFIPKLISDFLSENEFIKINVEEKFSHEIVKYIQEGKADFGIARRVSFDEKKLEIIPYKNDHLVVVVNNSHPLAQQDHLYFLDTLLYEHLGLSTYAAMNSKMKKIAQDNQRKINFTIQISSIDAACRLINTRNILGIFPKEAAEHYQSLYNLVLIPLLDSWSIGELFIYKRRQEILSLHARKFLEFIILNK